MKRGAILSLMFFSTFLCFGQLTEKGNDLVVKAIKKNKIQEKILANEDIDVTVYFTKREKYDEKSELWGFKNLKPFDVKIGFKNNNYFIISDNDKITNSIYTYNKYESYLKYNDNIFLYLSSTFEDAYFILKTKNQVLRKIQNKVDLVNLSLEILNDKIDIGNSVLIKDIYYSLYQEMLFRDINNYSDLEYYRLKISENNIDDIDEELTKLNFNFIKKGSNYYYLYTKEKIETVKAEIKAKEEVEYNKTHITGNVTDYKENGGVFTGSLVDGKFEGKGILYTTLNDKSVKYEGDFKNGMYDGYGKLKVSKWTYSGSYSQEDYNETYEGEFKNGLFDGKGKHSIYNRATSRKNHFIYDGEFKNGIFFGNGKIVYNPTSHDDSWSYDGEWKNGKFDGFGVIKRYDKTSVESFKLASNKEFRGNFNNGKKNGEFNVTGLYQGKADFRFSYKITYKDDSEISKIIIFDDIEKRNTEISNDNYAYQSKVNAQNKANCENCNIDWKNSKSPKDDYTLWIKTGRKSGIIKMINGDEYNFDYENGKCKVTNGWFQSDSYYDTFDKMILDLLNKCKLKYCN